MHRRSALAFALLMIAGAARAQIGGGPGGGMGGGRRGGGGGRGAGGGGGSKPSTSTSGPPKKAETPVNQLQIVGVVTAIDRETGRMTIAYEPVEALNWPAGSQPFPVEKAAMLDGAKVGQKVRFSIDSGHISALQPFDPPPQP